MLGTEGRGITQLQKKINTLETELDQQKADRHSLLKGCKVAKYIIGQTREDTFQCVVISLKEEFYSHADALIGIYSEVGGECTVSQTVTLDLTKYPEVSGSPAKARPH